MTYNHSEAFCLMKYRSDDETEEEIIWNSRDGVTPFVISLRSGKTASHVDWRSDRCVPDYKPKPGERIFIDLTPEKAEEYAKRNVRKWRRQSPLTHTPSVRELARDLHERWRARH